MPLRIAQLCDRLGERGQPDDQHNRRCSRIAGEIAERADHPGGCALGEAGGPVVSIGSLAQVAAVQRDSRCVQRV